MMLNKLLNIKYPIIQGGMANIATAKLAAAVSNAGGLGLIAGSSLTAEEVKAAVEECRRLTDKPFGVNVMLMNPHKDAIMKYLTENPVDVVTTGAGNPSTYIPALKEKGTKVIPVVASVAFAVRMEKYGADAVIAEGTEAGGHIGESTTMTLVPQIVNAVSIPVIAAGGIADGRGFNAAIALGACGVQVGTCLLVADECPIHENYKNAVIKANDTSTAVTGRYIGSPVRSLKNQMSRQYGNLEKAGASLEEMEKLTLGSLRKAVLEGDVTMGSAMMGQIAGLCNKRASVKEILDDIMSDSVKQLEILNNKLNK